MNNLITIIAAVAVLAAGAWYFLAHHDHHHGHGHDEYSADDIEAQSPVRADGAFTIATSFYPLEYALARIVGDLATVINIGAGRDPHDFRPSTQDMLALQQADLVVIQGAEFEPWGEEVALQLIEAGEVQVLTATAGLELHEAGEGHDEHEGEEEHEDEDEEEHAEDEAEEEEHDEDEEEHEGEEDEHGHGAYDPHTWLDPVLFSKTVENLTQAIVTLDPENAATYRANATTLQADLAALNTAYETGLATCTADEVITSHDAFGYIAERYEFTIHTIAGISTQDLPSAQTLAELREEAEEGVNAILLEDSSVTAYGETLASETGLATLSINPIAYVIPAGEDYLSLMRGNLKTFQTALACNG